MTDRGRCSATHFEGRTESAKHWPSRKANSRFRGSLVVRLVGGITVEVAFSNEGLVSAEMEMIVFKKGGGVASGGAVS
ncbi:MAG: hypothetical protein M2R46_05595 [Verrucomicrobia subdivision 3 bacterium]|nr:hypothetical protein [Limisphaerales bacterium]